MGSNTESQSAYADTGTSSSLEPASVLESVTVEFDDYVAISEVSLEIPLGPATAIMGLSGSGKSTLLKVAAGLIPPGAGRVRILGHYMRGMSDRQLTALRRRVGFVFQEGALWQNMSIYRNLEVPLEHQKPELTHGQRKERIERALGGFRFPRSLSLRPSVLSAGEAKIISFVRSTITDPQLLFLDEPTTFIDRSNQNRIFDRLRTLKRAGTTLVMVTHNPTVAAQLADRVIVMYDSQVIAHDTMSKVSALEDERVHEVLEEVLGDAVTYDEDLLSLLGAAEP
ncbi:MAG: ABC transporter ATP-binding protein [Spirochaetota bacterium]